MTVGERIRERRTALGINQTQLADKISVSKQTLYKYETGVITNIPSDKIEKIAETLNTTPEVLMGWKKTGKCRNGTYGRHCRRSRTNRSNQKSY